jgi:hypothetical protein
VSLYNTSASWFSVTVFLYQDVIRCRCLTSGRTHFYKPLQGYADTKRTCLFFRMSVHVITLRKSVSRDAYKLRSLINSCRSLYFWMVHYSNIQCECAPDNVRGRSESNWRIVERANATSQVSVKECALCITLTDIALTRLKWGRFKILCERNPNMFLACDDGILI